MTGVIVLHHESISCMQHSQPQNKSQLLHRGLSEALISRKQCFRSQRHVLIRRLLCRRSHVVRSEGGDGKVQRAERQKRAIQKTSKSAQQQLQSQEPRWGIFSWGQYATPWEVPWGGKELAFGMVAWAVSFLLVGLVIAPLIVKSIGITDYRSVTAQDKSLLVLANQIAETVVGLAIINNTVKRFGPLPDDLFQLSLRDPFTKPRGWLTWGLLGIVLSPVVIGVTVALLTYSGYEAAGGQGTADGVAQIISLDLPTYASLFTVTGVLAPLLEETVFRGFLLTSLTKWVPTPAAVLLSATAFGLAHLSQRDLPQLIALGTLLGFSYVRSRNLLTPMLIHGAWNSVVLTVLFALTASGVDVQQMLKSS